MKLSVSAKVIFLTVFSSSLALLLLIGTGHSASASSVKTNVPTKTAKPQQGGEGISLYTPGTSLIKQTGISLYTPGTSLYYPRPYVYPVYYPRPYVYTQPYVYYPRPYVYPVYYPRPYVYTQPYVYYPRPYVYTQPYLYSRSYGYSRPSTGMSYRSISNVAVRSYYQRMLSGL